MQSSPASGRMLVVGGSHAEIPLIDAGHALGFEVITTGNHADGLGHRRSDHYVPADFSDPDAILEIASTYGVDAVVAGCNDFALMSTTYVADRLGMPGHDDHSTTCSAPPQGPLPSPAHRNRCPDPAGRVGRDPDRGARRVGADRLPDHRQAGRPHRREGHLGVPNR